MMWLLVALAGCATPLEPPQAPPDQGRALVEQAQADIAAGGATDAIEPLRVLLAAIPEDAHARGVLAHALLQTDALEESRLEGRLALAFDPTLSVVAWNLACAHARDGQADPALGWLQRALATGTYERNEVAGDPDLALLQGDHRLAVYYATGVLSRAEEDAVAVVDRDRGATGEPAILSVASMQLNRPLLSKATAKLAPVPQGGEVAVLERVETFSRGSAGDREYSQRTVHFTIVPLVPGVLSLGPFEVTSDTGRATTMQILLPVDGDPVAPPPGSAGTAWYGFPSQLDGPEVAALAREGVEPIRLAEGETPESLPEFIQRPDGGQARLLRFRASTPEFPAWIPPRPANARRSALVQRSTEGWSWVLDVVAP
jgi:hypothetical protein